MKIGIANDHSAVEMKNEIVEYLKSLVMKSSTMVQIQPRVWIIPSMVKRLPMRSLPAK
jgi:hypothetical protein